jgi:hypothetical protein
MRVVTEHDYATLALSKVMLRAERDALRKVYDAAGPVLDLDYETTEAGA